MSNEIRFPSAFTERMSKQLGSDWPAFVKVFQHPPDTSIRLNPKKQNSNAEYHANVPWTTSGRYLAERPVFTLDPLLHAGSYYVQEASSMFLEQAFKQVVDLNEQLNILDLCAAPGGKSTHILSLINNQSLLVSNEVIRSRASILTENILKWGYSNSVITNNDPEDFQSVENFFDVMVVDAPCSGEGLFRKDPAAMEEWSPENVSLCASRQKRILSDVWPTLRENGVLIYCTCTYNESENEDNLLWFSKENDVEFLKLNIDPLWGIEESIKENVVAYRFFPHRIKGEGFFMSVIRKKSTTASSNLKPKKNLTLLSKKSNQVVQSWLQAPEIFQFFQHNEYIYVLPSEKINEVDILRQHLKVLNSGTTISNVKHDKFIPEHALAMSVTVNKDNFKEIEVTKEHAIAYLRRDTLSFDETEKGYCLVTFENVPLGWVNSLGNRFNNMYPSDWRIRMALK